MQTKVKISSLIKVQPEPIYCRVRTPEFREDFAIGYYWCNENKCYKRDTIKIGTIDTVTWEFTVCVHDGKILERTWPIMFRTEERFLEFKI